MKHLFYTGSIKLCRTLISTEKVLTLIFNFSFPDCDVVSTSNAAKTTKLGRSNVKTTRFLIDRKEREEIDRKVSNRFTLSKVVDENSDENNLNDSEIYPMMDFGRDSVQMTVCSEKIFSVATFPEGSD